MKILAISDLHYDRPRRKKAVRELFRNMDRNADVLVIAGDVGSSLRSLEECLSDIPPFYGIKLAVLGNHEFYDLNRNTHEKIEKVKEIFRKYRFHLLDEAPVIIENIGFVGNCGWYDYSFFFQEGKHGLNPNDYVDVGEGFKRVDEVTEKEWRKMCEAKQMIIPKGEQIHRFIWNDGRFINNQYSDLERTYNSIKLLRRHTLQLLKQNPEQIVVVTHHIPFISMLEIPENNTCRAFGTAFLGSTRLGGEIKKYKEVNIVICGHSHNRKKLHIEIPYRNPILCYEVSLNPREPRFTEIEI